jgi:tetratricopeptide (TPR) repeat protein
VLEAFAGLLEDSGDPAEAEKVYRRAIALHEQTLGSEHPETAVAMTNLAGVLEEQGRMEPALELFERAAEIFGRQTRRMRGPHPHLKSALRNLGRALRKQGVAESEIEARLESFRSLSPRRERSRPPEE